MGLVKPRRALATSLGLFSLAILAVGCREELGPERFPVADVGGEVVEGQTPVGGGWIEFIPVEGTVGNLRCGKIQPDGTFRVGRVPVGENAVRLVHAPIGIPGGSVLFGRFDTPVRRVIRGDEPNLRIDLLDEAVRYQAARSRTAARHGRETGTEP
jgi:hypothetical protein